ncbi:MAG: SulP family inorganic anion transporter [Cyanobacteria bacterium]|nr:SulP family inorganic anion transporter [Cyanobacteriota bacterium]
MTTSASASSGAHKLVLSGLKPDNNPEKPENGLAGLKHWRQDLMAGLVVATISTPFSIGIAIASGAPPITGLTSAIIAGFVLPFLGGSFVTISGPAAGLAPVLYAAMMTLGGTLEAGYPLLLPVIFIAGVVQIILSKLKAARFSAIFPAPVVEGMLTAIGLLIIVKQLPQLFGHPFKAHAFWGLFFEAPHGFLMANHTVFGLGLATLITIPVIAKLGDGKKWSQIFPPKILAVILFTLVSLFLTLDPKFRLNIPDNPLHGIVFPHFAELFAQVTLWKAAITLVIMLTLIDGIESLATINAVDKIDPFRRKSDPEQTLFAMGVSNICSSLIGGLTIIPGGVKSTANIMAGGRTQWANFYNAAFLLVFLLFLRPVMNTIPLSILSALLVFTGYKLCRPSVWKKMASVGWDQALVFVTTVLLTLNIDLLWGILGGTALAVLSNYMLALSSPTNAKISFWGMFQNPVKHQDVEAGVVHLYFNKPLLCTNYMHLKKALDNVSYQGISGIQLHLDDGVTMVDHTTLDHLQHFMDGYKNDYDISVDIIGLERMKKLSQKSTATHLLDDSLIQMMEAG